jgi:energy-coupling factor transporter ATP-binding protein EcfA2
LNTPIALICGGAGSGKDTLAAMLAGILNGTCIAQADPMKRFAATVFGFDENQLWGPSESRNAVDNRYDFAQAWDNAGRRLLGIVHTWVRDVLPNLNGYEQGRAATALCEWFGDVAKAHGFLVTLSRASEEGWQDKAVWHRFTGVERVGDTGRRLTPRYALQTLGTEWGRKISPAMWSEYAVRTARTLLAGGCSYDRAKGLTSLDENRATPDKILAEQTQGFDFVIITDGRFRNEIVNVKAIGGTTIEVMAPYKHDTIGEAGVANHRSEAELKAIPNHFFDFVIVNDKEHGLEALKRLAHTLVNKSTKPLLFATAWPEDICRTK